MNNIFAEATTGVAFVLTLSKRQCNTLLRLYAQEQKYGKPQRVEAEGPRPGSFDKDAPASINLVQVDNLRPLRDRGLVFWFQDLQGKPRGFGGLTKAGELAAGLLIEAGLTIEATNTLSVLRRIERQA